MPAEELKTCPFCGGEGMSVCGADEWYYVVCEDCWCASPSYPEMDQAFVEWNRRAGAVETGAHADNSAMDAIAGLFGKWLTTNPDAAEACVVQSFIDWALQQHQ